MKNIETLNQEIEILLIQKQKISSERYACKVRFEKALTRCFEKYFRGIVSEDVKVECTQSTIQFKKMNEEGTYEKELFTIYLREEYFSREGREQMYRGCELSYYTTSTNSDFELERLENLGRVANLLRNFKDEVVNKANELGRIYEAELKMENCFQRESELEKQISTLRNEIKTIQREEKKQALFSEEGLPFEKEFYIQLKANFTVRVKNIKLIDIAKSGKTATAVFTYAHGNHVSREERVSIEKIVSQVISAS
jgi:hypothetical protein